MSNRISNIKIIGYGLAALYTGFLLLSYLGNSPFPHRQPQANVMIVLFGIMIVSAIAVAQLKEWGRILLICGNVVMAVYLLQYYVGSSTFIPITFFYLGVFIILFFSQDSARMHFPTLGKKRNSWKCILIIDDDDALIKTVRPILISQGYSVLSASTGEQGLEMANTLNPNLIILDVILPGIKGRDVCKQLKENEKTKNIPVIFLTAKDSADDIQAELEAGGERHLTKPVESRQLMAAVGDLLDPQ